MGWSLYLQGPPLPPPLPDGVTSWLPIVRRIPCALPAHPSTPRSPACWPSALAPIQPCRGAPWRGVVSCLENRSGMLQVSSERQAHPRKLVWKMLFTRKHHLKGYQRRQPPRGEVSAKTPGVHTS